MAVDTEPPSEMAPSRVALMRVYAALDRLSPRDPRDDRETVHLEQDLRVLGVDVEHLRDIDVEFKRFATAVHEERTEGSDKPMIPLVRVVHTTTDALAHMADAEQDQVDEALRMIAAQLVKEQHQDEIDVVQGVARALRRATAPGLVDKATETWNVLRKESRGLTDRKSPLHPEVLQVRHSSCTDRVFRYLGELASRIDAEFIVDHGGRDLGQLARACWPPNWPYCNSFFCSLEHCPERDAECPGTTPYAPRVDGDYWRTVFEEKVLACPGGSFPDTFLLFTWRLERPNQLVLQYELTPRRSGDQTRLRLDEGSIQIDKLGARYRVRTVKILLFDDARLPSGGQTLGRYACELGWVDHSIAQFTDCAQSLPVSAVPSAGIPERHELDPEARLGLVVERCEQHLRERADEIVADADDCVAKLRAGDGGFDAYMADALSKAATRAGRDGARWVEGQLDYALASVDLARRFTDNWRRARA